jgi:acetyl-CoA acetyltransferase family protein
MGTQHSPDDVVILSGVRTGFGSFGGALKDFSATDLGAIAGRGAIERAGLTPDCIDHVIVGNALQTSADAIYLARHVALKAGCRVETPAVTVNRLCGSGFEAVIQGAMQIQLGESDIVLTGGTESMSQAPHVVRGARWGLRLGTPAPLEDLLWEALRDTQCNMQMAETAEKLATQYQIPRADVDAWALRSQQRARDAWATGAYADEVIPVGIKNRKTKAVDPWTADEHMRPDSTAEGLAKLPPYFRQDGVVTAGNASGIADGAAALVLARRSAAEKLGLKPVARIRSHAVVGVDPSIMGIGPAPAARKALQRASLDLAAIDLVEVNEAFSAQFLAVLKELQLDPDRTNVDGGAIALGHPLGASGARLTAHLAHALRRRGKRFGLASACIGGGQGQAIILEAESA